MPRRWIRSYSTARSSPEDQAGVCAREAGESPARRQLAVGTAGRTNPAAPVGAVASLLKPLLPCLSTGRAHSLGSNHHRLMPGLLTAGRRMPRLRGSPECNPCGRKCNPGHSQHSTLGAVQRGGRVACRHATPASDGPPSSVPITGGRVRPTSGEVSEDGRGGYSAREAIAHMC